MTSSAPGAETVDVWTKTDTGPYCELVWAPEIHRIDGKWYVYYAADDGNSDNHRSEEHTSELQSH